MAPSRLALVTAFLRRSCVASKGLASVVSNVFSVVSTSLVSLSIAVVTSCASSKAVLSGTLMMELGAALRGVSSAYFLNGCADVAATPTWVGVGYDVEAGSDASRNAANEVTVAATFEALLRQCVPLSNKTEALHIEQSCVTSHSGDTVPCRRWWRVQTLCTSYSAASCTEGQYGLAVLNSYKIVGGNDTPPSPWCPR